VAVASRQGLTAVRRLSSKPSIFCVGTMDTKSKELNFLAARLRALGSMTVRTVDVSATNAEVDLAANVSASAVLAAGPRRGLTLKDVTSLPRGEGVAAMSEALVAFLKAEHSAGRVSGVIGIGGSGGTSLITAALRSLPVGLPKLMVSTVAAGNTAPYVGHADVTMMPSVVDVAGLNAVSTSVLTNAAGAMHGMVAARSLDAVARAGPGPEGTVAMTMFGVTTPCVDQARAALEAKGGECLVFHATGTGGKAMEGLVSSGLVGGVLDLTTTEVADEVVGGVMSGGPNRLEAAVAAGVPLVVSVGAVDMVNFGAKATVPAKYSDRLLFVHNEEVTLMRTTKEENEAVARFIADKLAKATRPVRVLLPEKGVSMLDAEGMPFFDPEATGACLGTLERELMASGNGHVTVERLPLHINDPAFAAAAVAAFESVGGLSDAAAPSTPAFTSSSAAPSETAAVLPTLPADLDPSTPRGAILPGLHAMVARGVPIVGAGAGTGISAKSEEAGGADLIVIYNSGRFRMGGRGSLAGLLPFDDANRVVEDMGAEVLPVVKKTPVLAGVMASDPFRSMPRFLERLRAMGFAGIQNFPTVGLYDGKFRRNIEETGMGYDKEVDAVRLANGLGLLTTPYSFTVEEAAAMAEAGADIVVAHVGLTTSGTIGASTAMTLEEAGEAVQAMADAVRRINPHCLVLCHGGPIAEPADAQWILDHTVGVHGFYGASSMERLPVETAIANCVREFKAMKIRHRDRPQY